MKEMKTGIIAGVIIFLIALLAPTKARARDETIEAMRSISYLGREDLPRGMRNNNPGNIEINSANNWQGKIRKEKNTDGRFEQFLTYGYGVRAMIRLIRDTYIKRQNLDSVELIIHKWAPTSENNTRAYIDVVAKKVGVARNAKLETDYLTMKALIQAMATHENGRSDAITDPMFALGWELAE